MTDPHKPTEDSAGRSGPETGIPDHSAELAELRAVLAEQREVILRQQSRLDALSSAVHRMSVAPITATATDPSAGPAPSAPKGPWSRRALLLGGLGATAGAAASLAGAAPAAAGTGTMQFGTTNNAGTSPTKLTASTIEETLRVENTNTSTAGSALHAQTTTKSAATARSDSGYGVSAVSVTNSGVRAYSFENAGLLAASMNGPAARFENDEDSGPPASGSFQRGSLFAPSDGSLWWCVTGGSPGVWRLVATTTTTTFIPITPTRVYDSRAPFPNGGVQLAAGTHRDISVAHGRDLTTGSVTVPNLVPAGARAVFLNLTIAGANTLGTVALAPGGAATYTSSAINFAPNQRLANGLAVAINPANRTVRAFAITADVSVIIDVYGYYL